MHPLSVHNNGKPQKGNYNNILLIEDNIGDARLVELLLEETDLFDYKIVNATTLEEGVTTMGQSVFDVVLLDLTLPDSRGMETLTEFISHFPEANVIVLTGLKNKEFGVMAVREGAQDYLVKGEFDSDWLAKSLKFSIERNQILQRLEEAHKMALIGQWEYDVVKGKMTATDVVYQILGYHPREIEITDEVIEQDSSHLHFLNKIIENALNGKGLKRDLVIVNKSGDVRYIHIQCSVSYDVAQKPVSISGVMQDITERKRSEQLEKDRDLALESSKIKDKLIARVSHEMRTPLHAVVSMSSMIREDGLSNQQQGWMSTLQHSSQHLLGMIDDILQISAIKNGEEVKFKYRTFDLYDLMSNLSNTFQNYLEKKKIVFEMDIKSDVPRYVVGDTKRMDQIFYNLVGNAFKFTDSGKIEVVASKMRPLDDGKVLLRFSVKDTGIGIPEEKLNDIFEPFTRVDHKNKIYEGTGLGLSIAYSFVEIQGGKMYVDSVMGEGSTFYFDLPMKVSSEDQLETTREDEEIEPVAHGPYKVLMAEDHKMNQYIAKKTLEKEYEGIQIELTVVENGKEAVELLEKEKFDLVLMDLQMPVMDGYEATEYIRTHLFSEEELPVLAVTADAQISMDGKFKQFKMNDFVLKPFDKKEIFKKISHYASKKY